MRRRWKGSSLAVPLALAALLGASASRAETEIDQKLDQVQAFDAGAVLDMAFTDPNVIDVGVPDFDNLGLNGGGGLASCKLAPRGAVLSCDRWFGGAGGAVLEGPEGQSDGIERPVAM